MARLTRITVNLSLIVAITIQPSMVFALKRACATSCASQTTCQGCGGCQVAAAGDLCGCCSGHADVDSDDASASGCGHSPAEQQRISFATNDDLAETAIVEGAVASESPSCCTTESRGSSSSSRTEESGCHCLHSPETPYSPVSRSPANEVRDLASLGFAFSVVAEPKEQLPSDRSFVDGLSSAILHFAQIELCVWRL